MEDLFPPFSFLLAIILRHMPLTDDFGSVIWSSTKGATNNTTPQTVVADPGTGLPGYVVDAAQMSVLNRDSASVTVIITITGGTSRIVESVSLATGDKWINSVKYVVSPGETLTVELAAVVTATQPTWTCAYYQVVN